MPKTFGVNYASSPFFSISLETKKNINKNSDSLRNAINEVGEHGLLQGCQIFLGA
jgi:hypothetical protein